MSGTVSKQRTGETVAQEFDARVQQALVQHQAGDLESAYRTYREVLEQNPRHAAALHYLGLLAQQTGHTEDAARLISQSIEVDATDPRAHNHLGQICVAQRRLDTAVACFRRALECDVAHVDSLNNLANALKLTGDLPGAIALYRRVIELQPRTPSATYNLGNALKTAGEHAEAIRWFERAIELDAGHYRAHNNLAVSLEQHGRFEAAAEHYRAALRAKPDYAKALSGIIALRDAAMDPQLVTRAEGLLAGSRLDDVDRVKLNYALGKHYDRLAHYERAFTHFAAANVVRGPGRKRFDPQEMAARVDRIIKHFSPQYFLETAGAGEPSSRPIFIVGMPRSGTTLTEQTLASHPQVFGAGELQDVPQIVKQLHPEYPRSFSVPDADSLRAAAHRYLCRLDALAPSDARRVTDKLPVNFMHLGVIATLFPRARVIHCRRDPLDTGLSCFMEQFDMQQDYTTDLEAFGHYYLQYERLMAHWRAVLPLQMHERRYEDVVEAPQEYAHSLIEHCGLEWANACESFQETTRAVMTPTRWQVRQPVYTTSVGRWRNYEGNLAPLTDLLRRQGYVYM